MIRVAVFGAAGKMGRTVCSAVEADQELDLVARIDPDGGDPSESIRDADVAVDFTRPDAVMGDVELCLGSGVHCVVGTTGLSAAQLEAIRARSESAGVNVFVAPNFSIGAVLSIRLAEQAARFFGSCEVIEMHHNAKLDAPSGTALRTSERIEAAWSEYGRPPGGEAAPGEREIVVGARGGAVGGVRVHSVRLQGLEAHQQVLFGGLGQSLSIRHDAYSRESYMPGVLAAVKAVSDLPGLTVGLEHLLGL